MSKRLVFALVLTALALFGLSACTPCDMVAPGLVSPDWREILDPNAAVLNWNYTDSCTPDNFEIYLSKDAKFFCDRAYRDSSQAVLPPGLHQPWMMLRNISGR